MRLPLLVKHVFFKINIINSVDINISTYIYDNLESNSHIKIINKYNLK